MEKIFNIVVVAAMLVAATAGLLIIWSILMWLFQYPAFFLIAIIACIVYALTQKSQ